MVQRLHEVLVHIRSCARYAVAREPPLKAVPHLWYCWPAHTIIPVMNMPSSTALLHTLMTQLHEHECSALRGADSHDCPLQIVQVKHVASTPIDKGQLLNSPDQVGKAVWCALCCPGQPQRTPCTHSVGSGHAACLDE